MSELSSEQVRLRDVLVRFYEKMQEVVPADATEHTAASCGTSQARAESLAKKALMDVLTQGGLSHETELVTRLTQHLFDGVEAHRSAKEMAETAVQDPRVLNCLRRVRRKLLLLQTLAFLAALPVGWAALWIAMHVGNPSVRCKAAGWVDSIYLQPFVRLACHARNCSSFWSFCFSGPTLWLFGCAIVCFAGAATVIGATFGRRVSDGVGFGMAAAPFALPGLSFLQHMGPVKGALGEIGGASSLYAVGSWMVLLMLTEKVAAEGATAGTFLRNLAAAPGPAGAAEGAQAKKTPAARKMEGIAARLEQLRSLHDDGLITNEEYEQRKRGILDGL